MIQLLSKYILRQSENIYPVSASEKLLLLNKKYWMLTFTQT